MRVVSFCYSQSSIFGKSSILDVRLYSKNTSALETDCKILAIIAIILPVFVAVVFVTSASLFTRRKIAMKDCDFSYYAKLIWKNFLTAG